MEIHYIVKQKIEFNTYIRIIEIRCRGHAPASNYCFLGISSRPAGAIENLPIQGTTPSTVLVGIHNLLSDEPDCSPTTQGMNEHDTPEPTSHVPLPFFKGYTHT